VTGFGRTATGKKESREILLISSGKQLALIGDGPWGPLIGTNFLLVGTLQRRSIFIHSYV
jgi:hypothetical protein